MKNKPLPKPFYDVKHDYDAALQNYLEKANMLRSAVSSLLLMGGDVIDPVIDKILREPMEDLDKASWTR